jgi:hypothetical protein
MMIVVCARTCGPEPETSGLSLASVESMLPQPARDTGSTLIQVIFAAMPRLYYIRPPPHNISPGFPTADRPSHVEASATVQCLCIDILEGVHFCLPLNYSTLYNIHYTRDQCLTCISPHPHIIFSPIIQDGYQKQRAMLRPRRRHDQIHQASRQGRLY